MRIPGTKNQTQDMVQGVWCLKGRQGPWLLRVPGHSSPLTTALRISSSPGGNRSGWYSRLFLRTNTSSTPFPSVYRRCGDHPPPPVKGPCSHQGIHPLTKDILLVSPSEWRGSCFPESLGKKKQGRASSEGQ